jgi:hypothetical protein
MPTIKIDNPSLPPGTLITIQGLGQFENGVATEIDPEVEEKYFLVTGRRVGDIKESYIEISGASASPDPVDAPEPETPVIRGTTETVEGSGN